MEAVTAIVVIFGMLFLVLTVVAISHHKLEMKRLATGFYNDKDDIPVGNDLEGEIIHPADLYAIGSDFTVANGLSGNIVKKGSVRDKPSRDTLRVTWEKIEPPVGKA